MSEPIITIRVKVDDTTVLSERLSEVCGFPRLQESASSSALYEWVHASDFGVTRIWLGNTSSGAVLEVLGTQPGIDAALERIGLASSERHVQSFALTQEEAWLTRHTLC